MGEYADLITKGTTPRDKSGRGTVNFVKVENISEGVILPRSKISVEEHEAYLQRSKLKENDILISIAGTLGRVGFVNKTILPANTNQALAIVRDYKFNRDFLLTSLNGNTIKSFIRRNPTIGAQPNLSLKQIENFQIYTPLPEEQKLVGHLFSTLDTFITLQQSKSISRKLILKILFTIGISKNMKSFSTFDCIIPTNSWEQWKLGNLAEIVRGASPRPIQNPKWFDQDSKIGWLRISDVTEQNGRIHFLEQRISEAGQEKTRVLHSNHLLLSIAATVGKPVINYVATGVHDGFLIFLNPKFDLEFMFQWLEMFRPQWQKYGQPGSQVNLNSDLVKNQQISIPSLEEQGLISSFFTNLDQIITLQQCQPFFMKIILSGHL